MNFGQCAQCKLSLSTVHLSPIMARTPDGRKVKVLICDRCKEKIQQQQRRPRPPHAK